MVENITYTHANAALVMHGIRNSVLGLKCHKFLLTCKRRRPCCARPKHRPGAAHASLQEPDFEKEEWLKLRRKWVYEFQQWSNHRSPWRHLRYARSIFSSAVLRALWKPVLFMACVMAGVSLYDTARMAGTLPSWCPCVSTSAHIPFQFSSPALSLLLVFRTNVAYARYAEARAKFGGLTRRCRDLMRQALCWWGPQDRHLLSQFVRLNAALPRVLLWACRHGRDLRQDLKNQGVLLPYELEMVCRAEHPITTLMTLMTMTIHAASVSHYQRLVMDRNITHLMDCMGDCEMIYNTPIPRAYTRHTCRFLVLWLALVPLVFWKSCGWVAFPAAAAVAFAFLGIDEIAIQIEEPFYTLPLETIATNVPRDIFAIADSEADVLRVIDCTTGTMEWQAAWAAAGQSKQHLGHAGELARGPVPSRRMNEHLQHGSDAWQGSDRGNEDDASIQRKRSGVGQRDGRQSSKRAVVDAYRPWGPSFVPEGSMSPSPSFAAFGSPIASQQLTSFGSPNPSPGLVPLKSVSPCSHDVPPGPLSASPSASPSYVPSPGVQTAGAGMYEAHASADSFCNNALGWQAMQQVQGPWQWPHAAQQGHGDRSQSGTDVGREWHAEYGTASPAGKQSFGNGIAARPPTNGAYPHLPQNTAGSLSHWPVHSEVAVGSSWPSHPLPRAGSDIAQGDVRGHVLPHVPTAASTWSEVPTAGYPAGVEQPCVASVGYDADYWRSGPVAGDAFLDSWGTTAGAQASAWAVDANQGNHTWPQPGSHGGRGMAAQPNWDAASLAWAQPLETAAVTWPDGQTRWSDSASAHSAGVDTHDIAKQRQGPVQGFDAGSGPLGGGPLDGVPPQWQRDARWEGVGGQMQKGNVPVPERISGMMAAAQWWREQQRPGSSQASGPRAPGDEAPSPMQAAAADARPSVSAEYGGTAVQTDAGGGAGRRGGAVVSDNVSGDGGGEFGAVNGDAVMKQHMPNA